MSDVLISLAPSGAFVLTVPSLNGAGPHDVIVPHGLQGLKIINKVLSARAKAKGYEFKIGFPASPTQAQVEAWLNEDQRRQAAEKKAKIDLAEALSAEEAQAILAGIDIGVLDL